MILSKMIDQFVGIALGALLFIFGGEFASLLNRASVKLYELFPRLRALPRSHLAGAERNLYLMVLSTVFLGLYTLHRP